MWRYHRIRMNTSAIRFSAEDSYCITLTSSKVFVCFIWSHSFILLSQVLMEDRQTNRLSESLNIFETIVNNRVFSNVSIILFLNKTDLLEEKVKQVSIKDYFPEFSGDPTSLADVQHFLVECFRKKRREQQHKPLYHHFTTAINTENIRLVFRDVKDTILHDNLKQLMLQWGGGRMKDGLMGGSSWCQGAFFLTYFPMPFFLYSVQWLFHTPPIHPSMNLVSPYIWTVY